MKELQNVWNWVPRWTNKDRYKTLLRMLEIRMLTDLLSFSNVNKYTMETRSKTNVFEWCNL